MGQNRRDFVKSSMTLFGGLAVAGSLPLQYSCKRAGPNDTIRIGLIGCRNMGYSNVVNFIQNPDVQIAALCDVDDAELEKRIQDIRNGEVKGIPAATVFARLREKYS